MTQTSEHGSVFQSTRSARSATLLSLELEFPFPISIHALREERDSRPCCCMDNIQRFQSTRSARSATKKVPKEKDQAKISIHALREERDCPRSAQVCC